MPSPAHTPGPWRVIPDPDRPFPSALAVEHVGTRQFVAGAIHTPADAALIAAAPALLAVARLIVGNLQVGVALHYADLGGLLRRAIAEAETWR